MKRWLSIVTVCLPVALVYQAGGFEFLERMRIDAGFRLAPRAASAEVVLVEIDPRSLRAVGVWPWPRGYHATVLENLLAAGASRVGFDIDFSSRSDPEEDRQFAAALAAAPGRVVLPVFREWQAVAGGAVRPEVVRPQPELARHAELATINVRPESDGLVRRYANRTEIDGRAVPSFAAALAGDPRPDLESFELDFGISTRSIPRLSYLDVLTAQFDPSRVEGKAVIVGPTAAALGDQIAVPVSAALPGSLLQATAFESQVQDRTLARCSRGTALAGILLLTVWLAPLFVHRSWRAGLMLAAASATLLLVGAAAVERAFPILIDVVPWICTTTALYASALVRRIDQQALGLVSQGAAIRRGETLMRQVVQSSFDAILTLEAGGAIATFNARAERMFGCTAAQARGCALTDFVTPAEGGLDLLDCAGGLPTEGRARERSGREFPVELVVTAIAADEDRRLVAVIRDITERKAHQEELKHRATHDPLTGLLNRTGFVERIDAALDGRPSALLLLDLDRFKEINDALGHPVGDRLLQAVALRLTQALREGDTLARLGGDEYAVFLRDTGPAEARRSAEALIESLRVPFAVEGLALQVDASLGIVTYPDHGPCAATLVQRADVAMYVAKSQRSGLVVYGPEQDSDHLRRLVIKGELGRAIDEGHLALLYQPKLHHASGRIVGAEALLRWLHPVHGYIPPDEFTGVAEHSGLIRRLTQWVIETAVEQAAAWRRQGHPLEVSVNLSARNLTEEDLPARLERVLAHQRLAPRHLILEITESVIMDDPDRSIANMLRLREMGLGISVDDFGTGYSSLAYLTRLPATELKIDKSFIMQIDRDPRSALVVRATIELAHRLGMRVVAEGVESEAIWQTLKQLGCDLGQGYHFGRPVPAERLIAMLGHCSTDSSAALPAPAELRAGAPAC